MTLRLDPKPPGADDLHRALDYIFRLFVDGAMAIVPFRGEIPAKWATPARKRGALNLRHVWLVVAIVHWLAQPGQAAAKAYAAHVAALVAMLRDQKTGKLGIRGPKFEGHSTGYAMLTWQCWLAIWMFPAIFGDAASALAGWLLAADWKSYAIFTARVDVEHTERWAVIVAGGRDYKRGPDPRLDFCVATILFGVPPAKEWGFKIGPRWAYTAALFREFASEIRKDIIGRHHVTAIQRFVVDRDVSGLPAALNGIKLPDDTTGAFGRPNAHVAWQHAPGSYLDGPNSVETPAWAGNGHWNSHYIESGRVRCEERAGSVETTVNGKKLEPVDLQGLTVRVRLGMHPPEVDGVPVTGPAPAPPRPEPTPPDDVRSLPHGWPHLELPDPLDEALRLLALRAESGVIAGGLDRLLALWQIRDAADDDLERLG